MAKQIPTWKPPRTLWSDSISGVDCGLLALALFKLGIAALFLCGLSCLVATAQTVSTATKLIVSPAGAIAGDAVTLTATVNADGAAPSSGRVTFYSGLTAIGTAEVIGATPANGYVSGTAVLVASFVPGRYSLVARFLGTSTLQTSTSDPVQVEVGGALPSQTSVAVSTHGAPYLFAVTTTGTGTQPLSGSIELLDQTSSNILDTVPIAASQVTSGLHVQAPAKVGEQPVALVSADFNHDGIPDLAVANYAAGTVDILLGTGGGYTLVQSLQVGAGPTALAAADFNSDGITDLAVVNSIDDDVVVFLGDPDHPGTFATLGRSTPVGFGPVALTVNDFNGDGLPDIAVANFWGNSVTVLLGDSNDPGTLAVSQTINVGQGPIAIGSADFNRDGMQDIAVANFNDNNVWVLMGNPQQPGQFVSPKYVSATGPLPTSLAIADLNDDGIPDIVVSNSGDATVSILWGIKGEDAVFPTQQVLKVGEAPQSVAVGDFNGDGFVDIAVANTGDGDIGVLLNGGNGTFQSQKTYFIGMAPRQVITLPTYSGALPGLATVDANADVAIALRDGSTFAGTLAVPSVSGSGAHQLVAEYLPNSGGQYRASTSNPVSIDLGSIATAQTISFPTIQPVAYGTSPMILTASASSGLPVSYQVISGPGSVQGNQLTILGAGDIVIEADQNGNSAYGPATAEQQTLQVNKAPLSITPNNARREFGQQNPAFSGSVSGVVAGDEISATYSSGAGPAVPPGTYSTPPYGISAIIDDPKNRIGNYRVTTHVGTLTILAAGSSPGAPIFKRPSPILPIQPSPLPPVPPILPPPGGGSPIHPIKPPSPIGPHPIGPSPLPPIPPVSEPPGKTLPIQPIAPPSPIEPQPIGPPALPPIAPISLPPGSTLPLPPIDPIKQPKPKRPGNPPPIDPIISLPIPGPGGSTPVEPGKPAPPVGPRPIHPISPWPLPPIVPIPIPLPPTAITASLNLTRDLVDAAMWAFPRGHHRQDRMIASIFLAGPTRVMQSGDEVTLSVLLFSREKEGPTGYVMFWDNGRLLHTSELDPFEHASANVVLHGATVHRIRATYSGDDRYRPVRSSIIKIVVDPRATRNLAAHSSSALTPPLRSEAGDMTSVFSSPTRKSESCQADFPYLLCNDVRKPHSCLMFGAIPSAISLKW